MPRKATRPKKARPVKPPRSGRFVTPGGATQYYLDGRRVRKDRYLRATAKKNVLSRPIEYVEMRRGKPRVKRERGIIFSFEHVRRSDYHRVFDALLAWARRNTWRKQAYMVVVVPKLSVALSRATREELLLSPTFSQRPGEHKASGYLDPATVKTLPPWLQAWYESKLKLVQCVIRSSAVRYASVPRGGKPRLV